MAKIEGVNAVRNQLQKLGNKLTGRESVIVGYTANYAVYVHEMTMKHQGEPRKGKHPSGARRKGHLWDPGGRAGPKFLENAAREQKSAVATTFKNVMKATGNVRKALLAAGMLLQRASQLKVPVDTGHLKASAFTRSESSKI